MSLRITREVPAPGVLLERLEGPGGVPTWAQALHALQTSPPFREQLTEALIAAPWRAFFWETPPVSRATLARPFEWVLVDSATLAGVRTDARPFAEHLDRRGGAGVVSFDNLGGDAHLIVPRPIDPAGSIEAYAHLADFVRGAPGEQVHELWRTLGAVAEERLTRSDAPCWISTSGLGVFWVHVRLDQRPKYVTYAPYRAWPTSGTS